MLPATLYRVCTWFYTAYAAAAVPACATPLLLPAVYTAFCLSAVSVLRLPPLLMLLLFLARLLPANRLFYTIVSTVTCSTTASGILPATVAFRHHRTTTGCHLPPVRWFGTFISRFAVHSAYVLWLCSTWDCYHCLLLAISVLPLLHADFHCAISADRRTAFPGSSPGSSLRFGSLRLLSCITRCHHLPFSHPTFMPAPAACRRSPVATACRTTHMPPPHAAGACSYCGLPACFLPLPHCCSLPLRLTVCPAPPPVSFFFCGFYHTMRMHYHHHCLLILPTTATHAVWTTPNVPCTCFADGLD